jgi:soluble lytic murein transglycosylase
MGRRRSTVGRWLVMGLVLLAVGSVTFVYLRWWLREYRYSKMIVEIAPRYGVEPSLVKAVMRQESGFDPFARSRTGAVGLMQVMPATGRAIGIPEGQLWNERTNIGAGAWLLAHALEYWRKQPVDDPVPFALAEYNAGRGVVLKWVPTGQTHKAQEFVATLPNTQVRYYVQRVLGYYADYRAQGSL